MKVKLTKRARIWHEAGETVEVSPAEGRFLLSVKSAVKVAEETKTAKKKK
ncbi:MAG: hypothetical protein IIY94_01835 [Oscillospiraceae bacterium]|nr:hypothetical protein [Oscillospiraceae bacterium]MBQ2436721.1 hypothetical protein [Clostridia bacterium]